MFPFDIAITCFSRWRLFQKLVVCAKFDVYVFITITESITIYLWGYYPPSSQSAMIGDLRRVWLSCLGSLVFLLPITFTLFGFYRTWWWLFQGRVVRTKFNIYIFIACSSRLSTKWYQVFRFERIAICPSIYDTSHEINSSS